MAVKKLLAHIFRFCPWKYDSNMIVSPVQWRQSKKRLYEQYIDNLPTKNCQYWNLRAVKFNTLENKS